MNTTHYDLLVIGSGQAGNPLARAFASAGRRAAVIERVHVGGTCINEGCTPSKTMVAGARVAHLSRRGRDYGVETGTVHVDMTRVRARKQSVVDGFRAANERGLADAGVDLFVGEARFTDVRKVQVTGADETRALTGDVVVIDSGQRPAIPKAQGLDGVPYLTSTSIMELTEVPEHLLVLGGGYVGLEFGQMFRRFGARVTVVHRGDQLLPREDTDVAEEIARILHEDGIDVVLGATTTTVCRADGGIRLEYTTANVRASVTGSHLLVATGRTPNTDGLNLGAAEVETDDRGYIRTNERLGTSAPHTYAVGDVKGGPAFTHISYDDFRILRANLLHGGKATTTGRMVPYTVFIDPPLGRIGMTERDARAAGRTVRVATLPMTRVARAIELDETRGFMKAVVDAESGWLLGAAVLGVEGGETAALFQMAMMGDLPYTVLKDGIFSHPTLAESLNTLFMKLDGE
jgi:pyruvate/2-oxoglutarate dehydrogenase complex dihydrolipoamide dehydrogenase (E3) component